MFTFILSSVTLCHPSQPAFQRVKSLEQGERERETEREGGREGEGGREKERAREREREREREKHTDTMQRKCDSILLVLQSKTSLVKLPQISSCASI